MHPMPLKIALPAAASALRPEGIRCFGWTGLCAGCVDGIAPDASAIAVSVFGSVLAVRTRYSVIARASCRVRRSSSSLELFSSMKKCGIFVLGRNALGAQIQVLMYAGESLAVMLRRSVPTFRWPLAVIRRTSDGFVGALSAGM